jgi:hypothetical protein
MNDKSKSRISIYWRLWLIVLVLLFAFRFTILLRSTENAIFNVFMIYAILTWLPIMFLNFYEGHKLIGYLEKNHHDKWEYLMTFLGSYGYNGFRIISFIFSKDDLGDEVVTDFKRNYKNFLNLTITVFLSYPITVLAIMLPLNH